MRTGGPGRRCHRRRPPPRPPLQRTLRHPRGAGDGIAVLAVTGPASALLSGYDQLSTRARTARRHPDETRTLNQLRVDLLLLDLAGTAATAGTPASAATATRVRRPLPPARVGVTIAATTLLGLDDHPADLAGFGPVPAELVRALTGHPHSRLHPLLVDPGTGALLPTDAAACEHGSGPSDGPLPAAGAGGYRPGAALDRYVRARDPRCTAPGCRAPAQRCDVDHVIPWPTGPTCACNLHPLCRRHHRVKHEAGWTVRRAPDGATVWTTTNGITATTPAQPLLPRPRVGTLGRHLPGRSLTDDAEPAPLAALRKRQAPRDDGERPRDPGPDRDGPTTTTSDRHRSRYPTVVARQAAAVRSCSWCAGQAVCSS